MNIEKMSTRLRQRSSWEAIDLGFSLARRWFLPLWLLWLVPAAVVYLLATALFDSNLLAWFIAWWLQPLYERPLLHFLSRALFSEYPPIKTELRNYWRIIKPQLLPLITLRRFNPARTFVEPVALLEGLKGSDRRRRLNVLGIGLNGTAAWFGILCWLFGNVFDFSQIALMYLVTPEEWNLSILDVLSNTDQTLHWIGGVVWFISASAIAPFFVAGGFSLYISRRTQLEGWDIELEFRKLSNRLDSDPKNKTLKPGPALSTALLAIVLPLLAPAPAEAVQQEEAKAIIEEITARPEFGEMKTRKVWRAIEADEKEKNSEAGWLADLLKKIREWFAWADDAMPMLASFVKAIMILLVAWLIVWLLMRYTRWLNWLSLPGRRKSRKKQAPTSLFGLALTKDSLPDDVTREALALLESGKIRDALSLLFRASLSHMIHHSDLPIGDSATEGECLRLVEAHRPPPETDYFRKLTRSWLLLAYAHQPPSPEQTRDLCLSWPHHYQPPAAEGES